MDCLGHLLWMLGHRGPGTHCGKGLWAYTWNICSLDYKYDFNDPVQSWIYTCHDSSTVTTCVNLWLIGSLFSSKSSLKFSKIGLWAHKHFVKWVIASIWCVLKHIGCNTILMSVNSSPPGQNDCHFTNALELRLSCTNPSICWYHAASTCTELAMHNIINGYKFHVSALMKM